MTRREFLKIVSSAGTGFIISQSPLGRIIPLIKSKPSSLPSYNEEFITTSCLLCPAGCGIKARVFNGILISVKGNKLHPISRGGICAKGLMAPYFLYHPERIKSPLKRKGKKGTFKFIEIKSETAIEEIAEKIKEIIKREEQHRIYFLNGRPYGLMDNLIEKFMYFIGSNSLIKEDIFSGLKKITEDIHGKSLIPVFDIKNSNYVLSIGSDLFDGFYNPVGIAKAFSYFRGGREGKRGILVHVEPRYSITSSKADRWIKINPNSYYEFLLGIHYVIIKEKLYDEDFIKNFVEGFKGFKKFIEKNVHLQDIEIKTGVPGGYIYLIAREFVDNKPSVCIPGFDLLSDERFYETLYLSYILNIITGNVEKDGGVKFPYTVPYKRIKISNKNNIKDRISSNLEENIDVLFLYYSNPLYKHSNREKIKKILEKTDTVISFSPFLDETSYFADYIIPDHVFLERWEDVIPLPVNEEIAVGITKPVVNPIFKTMHTGDFIIHLSKKINPEKATKEFPYKDFKDFLFEGLKTLYNAQTGAPFEDEFEAKQIKIMEESGFWFPSYKNFKEFKNKIIKRGGWFDPGYTREEWGRILKEGKFKIKKEILKEARKREENLYLYIFKPLTISFGTDAIIPLSHEIIGFNVNVMYDSFCEISKELAENLNLKDDDEIEIESENGKIKTRVKIVEKGSEKIISFPLSLGHKGFGKFSYNIGKNPLGLFKEVKNSNIIKVKIRRL